MTALLNTVKSGKVLYSHELLYSQDKALSSSDMLLLFSLPLLLLPLTSWAPDNKCQTLFSTKTKLTHICEIRR